MACRGRHPVARTHPLRTLADRPASLLVGQGPPPGGRGEHLRADAPAADGAGGGGSGGSAAARHRHRTARRRRATGRRQQRPPQLVVGLGGGPPRLAPGRRAPRPRSSSSRRARCASPAGSPSEARTGRKRRPSSSTHAPSSAARRSARPTRSMRRLQTAGGVPDGVTRPRRCSPRADRARRRRGRSGRPPPRRRHPTSAARPTRRHSTQLGERQDPCGGAPRAAGRRPSSSDCGRQARMSAPTASAAAPAPTVIAGAAERPSTHLPRCPLDRVVGVGRRGEASTQLAQLPARPGQPGRPTPQRRGAAPRGDTATGHRRGRAAAARPRSRVARTRASTSSIEADVVAQCGGVHVVAHPLLPSQDSHARPAPRDRECVIHRPGTERGHSRTPHPWSGVRRPGQERRGRSAATASR